MQIKDKYYKNIERLLYNYNMLKINIEIADKQLEEVKKEDGVTGVRYDEAHISETYSFYSQTEDAAVRNITEESLILKRKEKLENKLNILDRLIEGLNDTEKTIIKEYYIEGKQWWQIGYLVKYSERHCKRIRTEAIKKLTVGLYGEEAIKE